MRDITYSSSEEEEEEECAEPEEEIEDAPEDLSVEPAEMQPAFVIPDEIDEAGRIVGGPDSDIQVTHPMICRKVSTTARQLSIMKPGGRVVNSSVLALQLLGTPDVDARIDGIITRGTHQSKSTGEFSRFCVCLFSTQDRNNEEKAQFCSIGSSSIKGILATEEPHHLSWESLPHFLTPEVEWIEADDGACPQDEFRPGIEDAASLNSKVAEQSSRAERVKK